MNNIWSIVAKYAFEFIVQAGGVVTAVLALAKFFGTHIMESLLLKKKQLLEKDTERYKTELDKKVYVSKVKFDKEFEIYQELSEKNLSMVYAIGELLQFVIYIICIYSLPEKDRNVDQEPMYDPEKRQKKADYLHKKACSKLNRADFSDKKYAPFIKKEIYEKYRELYDIAKHIFTLFGYWKDDNNVNLSITISDKKYNGKKDFEEDIISKQKELSDLSNRILDQLRNYLEKLETID